MLGMSRTAPLHATRLAERAQFVKDHPGWTFADYDNAAAGDIAFQRSYEQMLRGVEQKALEDAARDAQEQAAEDEAE